eukprot:364480-Chlamydomonas_euryale.AAC.18
MGVITHAGDSTRAVTMHASDNTGWCWLTEASSEQSKHRPPKPLPAPPTALALAPAVSQPRRRPVPVSWGGSASV